MHSLKPAPRPKDVVLNFNKKCLATRKSQTLLLYATFFINTLLSPFSAASNSQNFVFISLTKRAYVEPIPYADFAGDLRTSSFRRGNFAMDHTFFSIGTVYKTWRLGFIQRRQAFAKFSRDSAEVIYLFANKKNFLLNKTYLIDITASQINVNGLQLGKKFQVIDRLQFEIDVNFLYGTLLNEGTLQGKVNVDSESDISFKNLQLNYTYTEDKLFDRRVTSPTGLGASIDVRLNWQLHPRVRTQLEVINLLGLLHWSKAPNTIAEINSNKKSFDENGYVTIDPSLEGHESYTTLHQTLPRMIQIVFDISLWKNKDFVFDVLRSNGKTFYSVGTGFRNFGHWRVLYNWVLRAPSLRYENKNLTITIQSDQYNYNTARMLRLDFRYRWHF